MHILRSKIWCLNWLSYPSQQGPMTIKASLESRASLQSPWPYELQLRPLHSPAQPHCRAQVLGLGALLFLASFLRNRVSSVPGWSPVSLRFSAAANFWFGVPSFSILEMSLFRPDCLCFHPEVSFWLSSRLGEFLGRCLEFHQQRRTQQWAIHSSNDLRGKKYRLEKMSREMFKWAVSRVLAPEPEGEQKTK